MEYDKLKKIISGKRWILIADLRSTVTVTRIVIINILEAYQPILKAYFKEFFFSSVDFLQCFY